MAHFEYFWDDQANCLLIAFESRQADAVSVDWLNVDSYQTIAVGVPQAGPGSDLHILAVRLPPDTGARPVTLAITAIRTAPPDAQAAAPPWSERIVLDPDAPVDTARRSNWLVQEGAAGPFVSILDADDKVPVETISQVYSSPRHGQTIAPASCTSGEGRGGHLRLRSFHDLDSAGQTVLEIEIEAEPGSHLPQTDLRLYTLCALDHVLPALSHEDDPDAAGAIDLNALYNPSQATLGDLRQRRRKHVFRLPSGGDDRARHVSYLDRIAIVTSPPATIRYEATAAQSEPAGQGGAVVLVIGKNTFPYLDEGAIRDAFLAAQPARTTAGRDIVRAYAEAHKPMQPRDLEQASEITAAVYSEISHRIALRHGARASHLTPVDIERFLDAPSFFGLVAETDPDRLPPSGPRALAAALGTRDETAALAAFAKAALHRDLKTHPRLALWLRTIEGPGAAYVASLLPFLDQAHDLVVSGISPVGSDLGEIPEIAARLPLRPIRLALDVLTQADVLAMTQADQFVDAGSDALEDRQDQLNRMIDDTVALCRDALAASGLADRDGFEIADLRSVADTPAPDARMPGSTRDHRAYHYLAQSLIAQFGQTDLPGTGTGAAPLLRKVAGWLYAKYRRDFQTIQDIVRQYNVTDPVQLDSDKVVALKHGFAASDSAAHFAVASHDIKSWLAASSGDPPLIAEWKRGLNAQLEKRNAVPR